MNAHTNSDAGGPITLPGHHFSLYPSSSSLAILGMGKLSEFAISFWLLVGTSPTIQASSFTTDGFACVRIYLPNEIVLIWLWNTRTGLTLG